MYNKHKVKSWKCKEKGCNSTINVDEEFLTVTREPSQHKDHPELTSCRIAVLKAMNKMKIAVKDESKVGLKVIYERYKQSLTDQKFSLRDITSINDGKFPTFSVVTNTLKNIRGTIMPILPKNLDEIDFDIPRNQRVQAIFAICVSLESFNIESQDGFTNFSDEEDDDDDDFDDDPYFEDPDLFNPHRKTESLYTSQSSIIAMAIDIESLLQPSIIVAEVITNLCLECSTQLIVGSFIVCSNCHKNVHYLCNKPTVTSYYKKNTKNFNVIFIFVNQPKNRYFIINQ